MKRFRIFNWPSWVYLGLILFISVLSYANILGNKFVWDDPVFIENWPAIRKIDISGFFKGDFPQGHAGVWRPVVTLFMSIDYQLFGADPLYYHLQAIAVHVMVVFLVYLLVEKLLKSKWIGLSTALLFAVHPVHTEAISFVTGSLATMGAMFFLGSAVCYLVWKKERKTWQYFASLLLALTAFFMGEMYLTLPLVIILIDWYQDADRPILNIDNWIKYLPFLSLTAFYLILRFLVFDIGVRKSLFSGKVLLLNVLSLRAFFHYIEVLFFPLRLNIDYQVVSEASSTVIRKGVSLWLQYFDARTAFSILVVICSLAAAYFLRKKKRIFSFAVLWFYITLLPVFNFFPTMVVSAERYLYLASLGWCLLVGYLFYSLFRSMSKRFSDSFIAFFPLIGLFLISALFMLRTIIRNKDWNNPISLWRSAVKASSENSFARNNLGKAYLEVGNTEEAKTHLAVAIEINPKARLAYINLGQLYQKEEEYLQAIELYEDYLLIEDSDIEIRHMLAIAYFNNGKKEKAIEVLENTMSVYPNKESCVVMAKIYLSENNVEGAISTYLQAIEKDNANNLAYNNLAAIYIDQKDWDRAKQILEKALKIDREDTTVLYNLGVVYLNTKEMEKAKLSFEKAYSLNPDLGVAKEMLDRYFR